MRTAILTGVVSTLALSLITAVPASGSGAAGAGSVAPGHASTGPFTADAPLLGEVASPGEAGDVDVAALLSGTVGPTATVSRATTIDDRKLVRKTSGWKSVTLSSAYSRTLTCSTKKNAYLRASVSAASSGGSFRLRTGPKRGTVVVRTGGTTRVTKSTAASKSGLVWVNFRGAGTVDIKITKAGKAGVCVDVLKLNAPASAAPALLPGSLRQLNLSTTGAGSANGLGNAAVSPRGTMVAYWSKATNLYPGVVDGQMHLYIASVATGRVITLADTSAAGVLADDSQAEFSARALTWAPVESGYTDSRILAFGSRATNITPTLPAASNLGPFLFAKNLQTGAIVGLVGGVEEADWSPDGEKIAFSTTLVYGGAATDPNFDPDIWSLDLTVDPMSANLTSVSANAAGAFPTYTGGPTESSEPTWSPDSRRVMFNSYATTLVPGDTNTTRDIFIKTVSTQAITRVSTSSSGVQGNSYSEAGTWSPDGTRVAFTSSADNLVPGDVNSNLSVFAKTLSTGAVTLVSTTSQGKTAFFSSQRPHWSPDGKRIAYMSQAVDLLPPPLLDGNSTSDVYIKNLTTGLNQIVSITPDKRFGNAYSTLYDINDFGNGAWLPNGKGLVFATDSSNLLSTDANSFGRDLLIKAL